MRTIRLYCGVVWYDVFRQDFSLRSIVFCMVYILCSMCLYMYVCAGVTISVCMCVCLQLTDCTRPTSSCLISCHVISCHLILLGSVDMKDFLLTMVAFRLDPAPESKDMIDKTMRGDSEINIQDALDNKPNPILESEQSMSSMDDQCRLYFHVFDINETGYIDMEELKLVVGSLLQEGRSVSTDNEVEEGGADDTEGKRRGSMGSERRNSDGPVYKTMPGMGNIEELFKVIDIDKSGKINYEEFQKFYDAVLTFSSRRSVM